MPIRSFIIPEIPADEEERLAALRRYEVLDTLPEPEFDAIVREAAATFDVPTAVISLVDRDRQWFKARIGLDPTSTPRAPSFCGHAIHSDEVLTIADAAVDKRFAGNPAVVSDPGVRFYAGAPLITPDGYRIGTLCLVDTAPRTPLSAQQVTRLRALADKVMKLLEIRIKRVAASED